MKISYNWIKDFIKTDKTAEELSELLTNLGLEVETIEDFESVKGGLKGIVIGLVEQCDPHPDADKLKVTRVNIGTETIQVVCGAPNVAKGQKVPVAVIGTTLYDEQGTPWKIKKGKLRGQDSFGMICSKDELGFGGEHSGIWVLPDEAEVGQPLSSFVEVEVDKVFEIGLTPNRADAMSHFGVARDIRAGLLRQGISLEMITPSVSRFHVDSRSLKVAVQVENYEDVPRYTGVTISGVSVKSSPMWLQNRLKAIGITPKNNIVDVTNYVLHELGQPLHAFDATKISGGKIVVRNAHDGEQITTLDGEKRDLLSSDIVICDSDKPMCIAGVMGGIDSSVTEQTQQVFLESAYFDPVRIRKTARRHAINSDAAFRFERGVDINQVKYALLRAALLIVETSGGEISSDVVDIYPVKKQDYPVFLTFQKLNKLSGYVISEDQVKSILLSLDIKINSVTDKGLALTVPFYRVDVQRDVDVIEEILRVYGYNEIAIPSKVNASMFHTKANDGFKLQNIIANQLVGQGFNEIMTNSLTKRDYLSFLSDEQQNTVQVLNPLSNDLAVMRQSLLFSGLEAIAYNINRKSTNLKFFEFGKTYQKQGEQYKEHKHLSLFLTGNTGGANWIKVEEKSNFFMLKGYVEQVFNRLGISGLQVSSEQNVLYQEGVSITHNESVLACLGVVNASILKHFGIKQEVLFADIHWDSVLSLVQNNKVIFREIAKYPEVKRDLSILIDSGVAFQKLYDAAYQAEKRLLKQVDLIDVYQGDKLPDGKKSYTLSFVLQDEKQTLTDIQIEGVVQRILKKFQEEFSAQLR